MQMPVQHPSNAAKPEADDNERLPGNREKKPPEEWPAQRPRKRKAMRPPNSGRRILREKRTISAMLNIYCRDHHAGAGTGTRICDDCERLLSYAHQRLDNCAFGELKQSCNQCTVHCYSKTMRPRILEVMRYAGPRMTLRYPLLSALHLLDKLHSR